MVLGSTSGLRCHPFNPEFAPFVLTEGEASFVKVIAEYIGIIKGVD
jgi:hypothetical protein